MARRDLYFLDKVKENQAKDLNMIVTSMAFAREKHDDNAITKDRMRYVIPFFERYWKFWRTMDRSRPEWEASSREFLRAVRDLARYMGFDSNFRGRADWGKCALEVAEALGDREAVIELCTSTISWPLLQLGELDEAGHFAKLGYDAAIADGAHSQAALAARTLSGVARDLCAAGQGFDEKARRDATSYATLAYRAARACANEDLRYSAIFDLSNAAMLGAHWLRAERGYRILVRRFEAALARSGHERGEAPALQERLASRYGDLAICLICQGRTHEARQYFSEGAKLQELLDSAIMRAESCFNSGALARLEGDETLARAFEQRGETEFATLGITRLPRVRQYLEIASRQIGVTVDELRAKDLLARTP